MHHVLIPIEAGHAERTASAVAQAVKLHQAEPAQVHLLRVRPPVSGHVAMLFPPAELHDLQVDWGLEDLAPAKRLLDDAGVPCDCLVKVGRSAPTIASVARALGCDHVIFGDEPAGIAERLFGSPAEQVRHLLNTQGDPVVLGS
jgi:nucleotide-binding universal stress UspA family protein